MGITRRQQERRIEMHVCDKRDNILKQLIVLDVVLSTAPKLGHSVKIRKPMASSHHIQEDFDTHI